MGHKDISVTLNNYTNVFDKFKEREVDKVNQKCLNEHLIKNNKTIWMSNTLENSKD